MSSAFHRHTGTPDDKPNGYLGGACHLGAATAGSCCQPLMFNERETWPAGSTINLGRLTIPQVDETYATLGSSPYWCWGYEEGINEHGVAIGNEGIWTKVLTENMSAQAAGHGPDLGPTGMDLLRLGLERGKTAREAMPAISVAFHESRDGQVASMTLYKPGQEEKLPRVDTSP